MLGWRFSDCLASPEELHYVCACVHASARSTFSRSCRNAAFKCWGRKDSMIQQQQQPSCHVGGLARAQWFNLPAESTPPPDGMSCRLSSGPSPYWTPTHRVCCLRVFSWCCSLRQQPDASLQDACMTPALIYRSSKCLSLCLPPAPPPDPIYSVR